MKRSGIRDSICSELVYRIDYTKTFVAAPVFFLNDSAVAISGVPPC